MKKTLVLCGVGALLTAVGIFSGQRAEAASYKMGNAAVKSGSKIIYKKGAKLYCKGKKGKAVLLGKVDAYSQRDGNFLVKKDTVYYTNNRTMYQIKTNGKKKKKLASKTGSIIGMKGKTVIAYHGKTIYGVTAKKKRSAATAHYMNGALLYNNKLYGLGNTYMYSFDLKPVTSSSKASKAWKQGKKVSEANYNDGTAIDGGYLYFVTYEKNEEKNEVKKIQRLDSKGKITTIVEEKRLELLAVKDGEVLYAAAPEINTCNIYLKDKNGVVKKIAAQEDFKEISVNWVGDAAMTADRIIIDWAGDDTPSGLYSMKKDGSEIKLLATCAGFAVPEVLDGKVYVGTMKTEDSNYSYTSYKLS